MVFPYADMREFIDDVEDKGELAKVSGANWDLEIGAISEVADRSAKCPAVLFDNVKDYPAGFRIFANPLNNYRRSAMALGLPADFSRLELLRAWIEKSEKFGPIKPITVNSGPAEENIQEKSQVDIWKFPTPRWHSKDGGRYIGTGDLVIMGDPDSGWVNVATYRVQVLQKNRVALYISPGHHGNLIAEKYWREGKPCPVAICCGQDPTLWLTATTPAPQGVSEYDLAGAIRGEAIHVFEGKYSGLKIPASAEIVMEGDYLPPTKETSVEGPFGEWTGYYASGSRECPVVDVHRVMHRTNPILMGAPPIRGTQVGLPINSAEIWKALEASGVPNVRGVWNHIGAGLFIVVSIKQSYPGHAKQAALAVLGTRGGSYHGTFVVVVDEDIDPSNMDEVIWAMTTRCDPTSGLDVVRGCWSTYLDPRVAADKKSTGELVTGRAIIDACRPFHSMKQFPEVTSISPEMKAETISKWGNTLGIGTKG